MSTPNFSHRSKDSKSHRSSSFLVGISVLLAGVVIAAATAADFAQGRNSSLNLTGAATAADTSRPTRPRIRLAAASSTSVTLAWTRSSDNVGVAGYEVYLAGRPTIRTTQTTYAITALVCKTTYRVGVAAYDVFAAAGSDCGSGGRNKAKHRTPEQSGQSQEKGA